MNTPEENREAYRNECSYRRTSTTIETLTTDKGWQQVFSGLKNAVKRESRRLQAKGEKLYVI